MSVFGKEMVSIGFQSMHLGPMCEVVDGPLQLSNSQAALCLQ